MICQSQQSPKKGFTLIEMIGVLAIIAILVAAIAPRIFEAIDDSKVTSATASVKSLQSAVAKYYADVGTLFPLDAAGVGVASDNLPTVLISQPPAAPVGLWSKFRGPYIEAFNTSAPFIGRDMILTAANAAAGAPNTTNNAYDFTGDNVSNLTATTEVVFLVFSGVSEKQFLKIDGILDDGVGTNLTLVQKRARGKVKYDPNTAGGTLRVYVAHK